MRAEMRVRRRRIRGTLPRVNVSRMHLPAKAKPQLLTPLSDGSTWPSVTPWLRGWAGAFVTLQFPPYAEPLQSDTGARLRVINLGLSGQTSTQLLHSLRNDPEMRKALGRAEIVTINIGLNDLGQARNSYQSGTCGGTQNEACLREVVDRVERNWDAIMREISSLCSKENTIVRTVGLGHTPRTEGVFGPYLGKVTHHIASSTADADIPYVEVRLADEDMSEDRLHPNDKGYQVIAEQLRSLGYEPLYPR